MSFVFRIATVKHEAEVYLSQGLHQEALSVYDRYMADNKDIQPVLKSTIEGLMRRIRLDALDANPNENERLSEVEITLIKKGWDGAATNKDRLISARVFMNLGFYEEAKEEYRRLLEDGCHTSTVFAGIAKCFVHLMQPEQCAIAGDQLAKNLFKSVRRRKAFMLRIARKIDKEKYLYHFLALSHSIARIGKDNIIKIQFRKAKEEAFPVLEQQCLS